MSEYFLLNKNVVLDFSCFTTIDAKTHTDMDTHYIHHNDILTVSHYQ